MQLPIGQIYHVTVDDKIPYFVYGNEQDNSSYRGPSNSLNSGRGGGGAPERSPVVSGFGWRRRERIRHSRSGRQQFIWSSGTGDGQRGRQRHPL